MNAAMNGNGAHPQRSARAGETSTEAIEELLEFTSPFNGGAPAGSATQKISENGDPVYRYPVLINTLDTKRKDEAIERLRNDFGTTHPAEIDQIVLDYAVAIDGVKAAQSAQAQYDATWRRLEARADAKAAIALQSNAEIHAAKEAVTAPLRHELTLFYALLLEAEVKAAEFTGAFGLGEPYDPSTETSFAPRPLEEDEAAGRGGIGRHLPSTEVESPSAFLAVILSGAVLGLCTGRDLLILPGSLKTVFEQEGIAPYFCMGLGMAATYLMKKSLSRLSFLASLKAELTEKPAGKVAAYLPTAMIALFFIVIEMSVMRTSLMLYPMLKGKADVTLWLVSLPLLLPSLMYSISDGIHRGMGRAADLKTADFRKRQHEEQIKESRTHPDFQQMIAELGKAKIHALRIQGLLAKIAKAEASYLALQAKEDAELLAPKGLSESETARINELLYNATHQMLILHAHVEQFRLQILAEKGIKNDPIPFLAQQGTTTREFWSVHARKLSWWQRLRNYFTRKKSR